MKAIIYRRTHALSFNLVSINQTSCREWKWNFLVVVLRRTL